MLSRLGSAQFKLLHLKKAKLLLNKSYFLFSAAEPSDEGKKFVSSIGDLASVNPTADLNTKIENLEKSQPFFVRQS